MVLGMDLPRQKPVISEHKMSCLLLGAQGVGGEMVMSHKFAVGDDEYELECGICIEGNGEHSMAHQCHRIRGTSLNSASDCELILEEISLLLLAILHDVLGMDIPPQLGMYILFFMSKPIETRGCTHMHVTGASLLDDLCEAWCGYFSA